MGINHHWALRDRKVTQPSGIYIKSVQRHLRKLQENTEITVFEQILIRQCWSELKDADTTANALTRERNAKRIRNITVP